MAQKKSIWQRLFSNDVAEEKGLSVVDSKAIRDTLQSEYGITIHHDNVTIEELRNGNYRRLNDAELAHIDQIFQYIPQLVANRVSQQAMDTAFRSATEGTFRVRLDAGMHLCQSHRTPGAYRAVGLSDATNQIAGNAELFANNATLSISNVPQIALGVFNVASMVTGQYFMSQVNSKLSALSTSVNRLEKLLDAQRHGKMKTAAQELADLLAKDRFIVRDTDKTNQAISQVQRIQSRANDEMNTCHELVMNELRDMKENDNIDRIKAHIGAINQNLVEYQYAAQLYGIATLLEVQFLNIIDPDELRSYREQIDRRVQQFKDDHKASNTAVHAYLDKTHALNDRSILQWIASGAAGIASTLATRTPNLGEKAFSFIDDLFSDHRKQQKERIGIQVKNYFAPLANTMALESPSSAINLYIDTVSKDIEFVKIDGDYYTNLPES